MFLLPAVLASLLVRDALVSGAAAHDHEAPLASLRVSGGTQTQTAYRSRWMDGKSECKTRTTGEERTFPDPVKSSERYSGVVFGSPVRPDELDLKAWRIAGPDGQPLGPSERLIYELSRVRRNRRTVGWKATFENPMVGHLLIDVRGWWPENEGCRGLQVAYWAFHLEVSS